MNWSSVYVCKTHCRVLNTTIVTEQIIDGRNVTWYFEQARKVQPLQLFIYVLKNGWNIANVNFSFNVFLGNILIFTSIHILKVDFSHNFVRVVQVYCLLKNRVISTAGFSSDRSLWRTPPTPPAQDCTTAHFTYIHVIVYRNLFSVDIFVTRSCSHYCRYKYSVMRWCHKTILSHGPREHPWFFIYFHDMPL
jgi:hypothetical protein